MAQPFARAIAMFALIQAAMGNAEALAKIGPYYSRGHGRTPRRMTRTNFHYSGGNYVGRYPACGAKEKARRLAQEAHHGR